MSVGMSPFVPGLRIGDRMSPASTAAQLHWVSRRSVLWRHTLRYLVYEMPGRDRSALLDFEKQTIQFHRSFYRGDFAMPKTTRSKRTLAMPVLLAEVLKEHLLTNKSAGGLVFCTSSGKPYDAEQALIRGVHPVLAQPGLARVGWRAFRRTVATLLQDLGEPVKVAREQLGHSNPSATLGINSHAIPGTQSDAVERMTTLLFPDVHEWSERPVSLPEEVSKTKGKIGGPSRSRTCDLRITSAKHDVPDGGKQ
jgi:integrase